MLDSIHSSENLHNLPIIPVMHCFDENYCLPAAVSFYSMLENASKKYFYKLYVLHSSNISQHGQAKLKETIKDFKNASLEFVDMGDKYGELWEKINYRLHFSKDVYYKLNMSSQFPQYDKMIITDVDVVWLGDIAGEFEKFSINEDYYLGGYDIPIPRGHVGYASGLDYSAYSDEEMLRFSIGGGFLIINADKMRQDKVDEKLIKFATDNAHRLMQQEQDVINQVCYPKIKLLSKNGMVCTYWYSHLFKDKMNLDNANWKRGDIEFAMNNPIQLHYACAEKPWKNLDMTKSNEWFKVLIKTNYFKTYLDSLANVQNFYARYKDGNVYEPMKIRPQLGKTFNKFFGIGVRRMVIKIIIFGIVVILDFRVIRNWIKSLKS